MLKEFLLSLAVATTPNPQQALEPVLPIIEPQTSGSDLIFSHTLTEETGVVPDEEKMQYDIYNAIEFFLNTESDESYFQDLHDKLYENPGNYFFFDFETVSDSQIAEMDCYYFKDGMTDPRYRFTEGYFSPDLYLTIRFSNEDNFFGSVEVGVQVNSQGELMGSSSSPQSYEIGEFPNEEIKELI
ncbi:MAG: hypothetical protein HYT09_02080, partial [Candidatus Levybacteria bacterium]|nr:hypothetical protein [Candidatus Levybacteria bacterium]